MHRPLLRVFRGGAPTGILVATSSFSSGVSSANLRHKCLSSKQAPCSEQYTASVPVNENQGHLKAYEADPVSLSEWVARCRCILLSFLFSVPLSTFPPSAAAHDALSGHAPDRAVSVQLDQASGAEDNVLQALKVFEYKVDNAAGGLTKSLGISLTGKVAADVTPEETQAARDLVEEAVSLIDQVWLDARDTGFSHDKWAEMCEKALQKPPVTMDDAHAMIKDLLSKGPKDAYTRFLEPSDFKSFGKYDVSGLGLNLGTGEEFLRKTGLELPKGRAGEERGVFVMGMIKGRSGEVAGVQQGDEVLEVASQDVSTTTPFDAAMLMAGPVDGKGPRQVSVKVRHNSGDIQEYKLDRPVYSEVANPVSWSLRQRPEEMIGYIKLSTFNARAVPELQNAIEELEAQNVTQLMLDLRDNRGGLVTGGVEIARMFLPESSVVFSTQNKSGAVPTRIDKSTQVHRVTPLPVTVLVNERTASASEILAGALKDNCRAVLVGSPTYGKGLIQSVYELGDSSGMVVTVGKYLTPSGLDIDRTGITPDFKNWPTSQQASTQLNACRLR